MTQVFQMAQKGEIALYISQNSVAMGIICQQCSWVFPVYVPLEPMLSMQRTVLIAARPQLMRADWTHEYATVEEPMSSTEAADSGSPTPAQADSSSEEPDVSGELADTLVEVSVPAAIIPPKTPTVTASPEQVVPVTQLLPKEIQASALATTSGITAAEAPQSLLVWPSMFANRG